MKFLLKHATTFGLLQLKLHQTVHFKLSMLLCFSAGCLTGVIFKIQVSQYFIGHITLSTVKVSQCSNNKVSEYFVGERTSDAGSQYRCGWVGRGIQPPSISHAPHTYTKNHRKRSFSHFLTCVHGPTNQPKERTKPLIELRVRN